MKPGSRGLDPPPESLYRARRLAGGRAQGWSGGGGLGWIWLGVEGSRDIRVHSPHVPTIDTVPEAEPVVQSASPPVRSVLSPSIACLPRQKHAFPVQTCNRLCDEGFSSAAGCQTRRAGAGCAGLPANVRGNALLIHSAGAPSAGLTHAPVADHHPVTATQPFRGRSFVLCYPPSVLLNRGLQIIVHLQWIAECRNSRSITT